MPNWPALLVAPSIALANAALAYALVPPSCASQHTAVLHALSACSLLACLALTYPAAHNWLRAPVAADGPGTASRSRRHFLSQVATMAGLLSALVVLAEWLPVWIVSPCAG